MTAQVTEAKVYRRIVRRSRHRSRSVAVVIVLVLAVLLLAYVGTECVLVALGRPRLLQFDVPFYAAPIAAVVGLLLVIFALLPARLARHELPDDRMAVVVDDSVLAGAIKNVTIREARIPADRVAASVALRRGRVIVTPTSGIPVDRDAVSTAADELVAALDPRPALRVSVEVAKAGVVGS